MAVHFFEVTDRESRLARRPHVPTSRLPIGLSDLLAQLCPMTPGTAEPSSALGSWQTNPQRSLGTKPTSAVTDRSDFEAGRRRVGMFRGSSERSMWRTSTPLVVSGA